MGRTSFNDYITATSEQAMPIGKPVVVGRKLPKGVVFIGVCACGTKVNSHAISEGRTREIKDGVYQGVCNICTYKR